MKGLLLRIFLYAVKNSTLKNLHLIKNPLFKNSTLRDYKRPTFRFFYAIKRPPFQNAYAGQLKKATFKKFCPIKKSSFSISNLND